MKIFVFLLKVFSKSRCFYGAFVVFFFNLSFFFSVKVNHYSLFMKGQKDRY